MKVELGPDDDGMVQWAELRHANRIPHGKTMEYRRVFYQMAAAGSEADVPIDGSDPTDEQKMAAARSMMESGGLMTMEDLANALVLAVVKDWSFGPVDLPTLLEVPTSDLQTIQDHCAADEYRKALQPDFGATPDTESPTTP